jgi:hypothetical protein
MENRRGWYQGTTGVNKTFALQIILSLLYFQALKLTFSVLMRRLLEKNRTFPSDPSRASQRGSFNMTLTASGG